LPPRVQNYVSALAQLRVGDGRPLVSLVLFGSAAKGGFVSDTSDVDLFAILPDGSTPNDMRSLREAASRVEIDHGFRAPPGRPKNALERFAERAGGNAVSCFPCTRGDLLSGNIARIFDLRPIEALLVDRIVLANIIASAVTVWGEDLLPEVPVPSVRRIDVFKALLGAASLTLLSAAVFPLLPDATQYAMGALKHSLHSCYFCYHLRTAPLDEEIAFFKSRLGQGSALEDLVEQRGKYRRSFRFVVRCLPALVRLHLRTARDNRFPRAVVRTKPA